MTDQSRNTAQLLASFLVPGLVFFISCQTMSSTEPALGLLYSVIFAVLVGSIFLLEKRAFHLFIGVPSQVIRTLLRSTTAVIVAAILLLSLGLLLPTPGTFPATVVFSTVMAILVLGTLSPLIKSDK